MVAGYCCPYKFDPRGLCIYVHHSILLRINYTYNIKCNVYDCRHGNERYIIYSNEIGSDKLRAPSCAQHEYATFEIQQIHPWIEVVRARRPLYVVIRQYLYKVQHFTKQIYNFFTNLIVHIFYIRKCIIEHIGHDCIKNNDVSSTKAFCHR